QPAAARPRMGRDQFPDTEDIFSSDHPSPVLQFRHNTETSITLSHGRSIQIPRQLQAEGRQCPQDNRPAPQSGVDRSVFALWLGHESPEITQIYLEADLALKEKALLRPAPFNTGPGRYRPPIRCWNSSK